MTLTSTIRLLKSAALGFVGVALVAYMCELLYSSSSSWPQRYFLHLKRITPHKGDLTVFWHSTRSKKLLKQIVGQGGDMVHYDAQGNLWVNQQKIGKPHPQDSKGQVLQPLKPQAIPRDHVFVYSPHDQSFDSRYQEVGLVPVSALQGKVIALW
jgi:conjugal transfer pilin signal peptidase TrbI